MEILAVGRQPACACSSKANVRRRNYCFAADVIWSQAPGSFAAICGKRRSFLPTQAWTSYESRGAERGLPCPPGFPGTFRLARGRVSALRGSAAMNWTYLRRFPWLDPRARFVASLPPCASLLDLGSSDGETHGGSERSEEHK